MSSYINRGITHCVMRAALILAGGKAERFQGKKKAFLPLKGKPLLQWVVEAVSACTDEIVLSGDLDLEGFGYPVVQDHYDIGPLAAFHAAFPVITSDYTFVTGCDMPFINPQVIAHLFDKAAPYSCCLPREGEFCEPLCCVYNTRHVNACIRAVVEQKRRMWDLIQALPHPRYVSFDELRCLDPQLKSFTNVNTEEDLEKAERL